MRRYLVSGTVQGVGFRAYARRQARRIGVAGWVRNLVDGRVEALARGSGEQLAEFEAALRAGPFAGSVTYLQEDEIVDEVLPVDGFEIR